MSGQPLFSGNVAHDLAAAALLVNGFTGESVRGRPRKPPGPEQAMVLGRDVLAAGRYDPRAIGERDRRRLESLAVELRKVFEAFAAADTDGAAAQVNAMIERYDVRPVLTNHDGRPWHLHYVPQEAGAAEVLGAGCAASLALLLDAGVTDRLAVCGAHRCDQVLFDGSRNASRRFCSTQCRNRAKTQAFRARRAAA